MSKTGRPVSDEERRGWSHEKLVTNINKCIRRDPGGEEDRVEVIMKRMLDSIPGNLEEISQYNLYVIASFIDEELGRMGEGCRERIKHSSREVLRRLRGGKRTNVQEARRKVNI